MRLVHVTRDQFLFGLARRGPYLTAATAALPLQPFVDVPSRGAIHGIAIDPTSEVRGVFVRCDDGNVHPIVEGSPVSLPGGSRMHVRGELRLTPLDRTDGRLVLQLAESPAECAWLSREIAHVAFVDVANDVSFDGTNVFGVTIRLPRARLAKVVPQAHVVYTSSGYTVQVSVLGLTVLDGDCVPDPITDTVGGTTQKYLSSSLGNVGTALSNNANPQHVEANPITGTAYTAIRFVATPTGASSIRGRFSIAGE